MTSIHRFVPDVRFVVAQYVGVLIGGAIGVVIADWRKVPSIWALIAIAVLFGPFVFSVVRQERRWRREVAALGHVEIDAAGVRWRRSNGSCGYDVPWAAIADVAIERGGRIAVLRRRGEGPVVVGVLDRQSAIPAGRVTIERFDELADAIAQRVPVDTTWQLPDRQSGTRMAWIGAGMLVPAIGLWALTTQVLGLQSILVFIAPGAMALIGVCYTVTGVLYRFGRAPRPLVIPLNHPEARPDPRKPIRVLLICHAVLVGVAML